MTTFGLQFKKILLLVAILFSISSCDSGCVEADEFDVEQVIVNAKPASDGITGKYNSKDGGQVANWHDTNLRSNGDPIKILVGGAWSSWEEINNLTSLNTAPTCKICLKKIGVSNCICNNNELPEAEKQADGNPVKIPGTNINPDCTNNKNHQDNPQYCTCTNSYDGNKIINSDTADNRFYYIIALDYQNKDGSPKSPDEQQPCKYTNGSGLYIGLFGSTGFENPARIYQLYSTEEICDIKRDKDGKCIDSHGNNHSKYLYNPPNNRIFMKDDMAGNDGSDNNPNDDQYHKAKEQIKVIIFDRYYYDNFGHYTLDFIGGVQRAKDRGLLEFIVGSTEDVLFGKINTDSNRREGGIIEFFYKALIQDSTFILLIRLCLILYVTIFGIGVLAGVVEISRKEVMNRVMKIGLIMLFTTQTSWYWYDHIIVGFFKDSMDSIISMFMSLSDEVYNDDTSMVKISQMMREERASNATRFAYVDLVMKKLFSMAVTKKIWGLFFSSFFGLLYIAVIYFLIGYFLYISVTAALIYITAILKLVFVIALGPLFILSSLFNQTSVMFKKWLSFMGARSLEIILLFITFYLFLVLIDKGFTDLLTIRTCPTKFTIGFFSMDILETETDRSFVGWIVAFINIGLLIFLLQTIMEKIAGVSNSLLSISGTASKSGSDAFNSSNSSATGIARGIMSDILSNGISAVKTGLTGVGIAARTLGVGEALEAIGDEISFRGPRGLMRDSIIDESIKQATASGKNEGKSGLALEKYVRESVTKDLAKKSLENDTKFSMLGVNQKSIENRLDQKLVQEPLRNFIKSESKRLKEESKPLFGKEMTDQLKENARKWSESNLYDTSSVENHLRNMKGFMKEQGTYNASEAVQKFSGNSEHRNKYLEHTEAQILKNKTKYDKKTFGGAKRAWRDLFGGALHNPNRTQLEFLRQEHYNKLQADKDKGENPTFWEKVAKTLDINITKNGVLLDGLDLEKATRIKGLNLARSMIQRIGFLDRKMNKGELEIATKKDLQITNAGINFIHKGYAKELEGIKKRYDAEKEKLKNGKSAYTLAEIKKNKEKEEKRLVEKLKVYTDKAELTESREYEQKDLAFSDIHKKPENNVPKDKMNEGMPTITSKDLPELDKKGFTSDNDINNLIGAKDGLNFVINNFNQGTGSIEEVTEAVSRFKSSHKAGIEANLRQLKRKLADAKSKLEILKNSPDKDKNSIEIQQLEFEIARDETFEYKKEVELNIIERQEEK